MIAPPQCQVVHQGESAVAGEVGMRKGDELAGKVALVTGGARNIGRAIARALAAGGAAVMVNANTSRELAQETVGMIGTAGGRAAMHVADITDPQAVRAMVEDTVQRYGRLDILVNNAAVRLEKPFGDITLEEWRRVLAIVLDGAFICAQAVLPHLIRAGGGSIVNIGGQTGHKGADGRLHVVAAKGGLAALTKGLALDLAPHHITVNCVVPGTVEVQRGVPGIPERPAHRPAVPPVGRRGAPEEIAAMVRMLCGPDARYITGQSIHLNGGSYMP
jgi:3-oxoacyl-[acyl-carrier protein] reductase